MRVLAAMITIVALSGSATPQRGTPPVAPPVYRPAPTFTAPRIIPITPAPPMQSPALPTYPSLPADKFPPDDRQSSDPRFTNPTRSLGPIEDPAEFDASVAPPDAGAAAGTVPRSTRLPDPEPLLGLCPEGTPEPIAMAVVEGRLNPLQFLECVSTLRYYGMVPQSACAACTNE